MALSTIQIADLLFKKVAAGKATTAVGAAKEFFEEGFNSRSGILASDIWTESNLIPETNPLLGGADQDTYQVGSSIIIEKRSQVVLQPVPGTNAFYHPDLKDIIPFSFGDGSYNYNLYLNDGTTPIPLGAENWYLDPDSGVLIFMDGFPAGVSEAAPPALTVYLYKGTKGEFSSANALSSLTGKTYAELSTMKANSELVAGQKYLITDFVTMHVIPGTTEVNTGLGEPLVIEAIAADGFSDVVESTLFPQDTIYYDFDDSLCEDNTTARPGKIVFRRDEKKRIETWYDWRNVRFRRYRSSLAHNAMALVDPDSLTLTVSHGWGVQATPDRFRFWFAEFSSGINHNAAPQLTVDNGSASATKPLVDTSGQPLVANALANFTDDATSGNSYAIVYYSPQYDAFVIADNKWAYDLSNGYYGWNDSDYNLGYKTRLAIDSADYVDVLTFADSADPDFSEVSISAGGNNNYNNIVFDHSSCNYITLKGASRDMHFAKWVHSFSMNTECWEILWQTELAWCYYNAEVMNWLVIHAGRLGFNTKMHGDSWSPNVTAIGRGSNWRLMFMAIKDSMFYKTDSGGVVHALDNEFGRVERCHVLYNAGWDYNKLPAIFINKSFEWGVTWRGVTNLRGEDLQLEHFTNDLFNTTLHAGSVQQTAIVPETNSSPFQIEDRHYYVLVKEVGGNVVLPEQPERGREVKIKDSTGQAYTSPILISTPNGEMIDGAADAVIDSDYGLFTLLFNGDEWNVVGFNV